MSDAPLTGGCLCGGVRFEIAGALLAASYCHCTRCQRRTGTGASAQVRVEAAGLTVTSGAELVREFAPPDGWPKCFCSVCGGALWSRSTTTPALLGVRLGTFDSDPGIRPGYRQFVAYAAAWEEIPDDGLPRYDEGKTD